MSNFERKGPKLSSDSNSKFELAPIVISFSGTEGLFVHFFQYNLCSQFASTFYQFWNWVRLDEGKTYLYIFRKMLIDVSYLQDQSRWHRSLILQQLITWSSKRSATNEFWLAWCAWYTSRLWCVSCVTRSLVRRAFHVFYRACYSTSSNGVRVGFVGLGLDVV